MHIIHTKVYTYDNRYYYNPLRNGKARFDSDLPVRACERVCAQPKQALPTSTPCL